MRKAHKIRSLSDNPHEFEVKTFCACLLFSSLTTWQLLSETVYSGHPLGKSFPKHRGATAREDHGRSVPAPALCLLLSVPSAGCVEELHPL